jgi:hypothetical protein
LFTDANKCLLRRRGSLPRSVHDGPSEKAIGAKRESGCLFKECGAPRCGGAYLVCEQLLNHPLKDATRSGKCATHDHQVTKRQGGWSSPQSMPELRHDSLRLNGALGYRDSACGTSHIDTQTGARETRANHRCQAIIHPRCDWNSCRQPKFGSGAWEQGSDARAREHFGRQRALIESCAQQRAAVDRREAPCRIPE